MITWVVDYLTQAFRTVESAIFEPADNSATVSDTDWTSPVHMALDQALAWIDSYSGLFGESAVRDCARKALAKPCLYYWGGPPIADVQAGDIDAAVDYGADCSGMTLTILVNAGYAKPAWAAKHRQTQPLQDACTLLNIGDQRAGDIACYNGHVTLVMAEESHGLDNISDGHSWCLSMSGGHSTTHGDDPQACAMMKRGDYRKAPDFRGYFRLPELSKQ